jgi:hypothetical protein
MRTRSVSIFFTLCLVGVLGCPKKSASGGGDASLDAAIATAVDAGPETTNESQITGYPDETAIDHAPATVKAAKATVLKAVPKGDTVATLKKGDTVAEVSEHNGYYRVVFADPNDATKKLSGWVVKFAFDDAPVPRKAPIPKCTGAGAVLVSDKSSLIVPRCTIFCGDDSDCPSGACEASLILDEKGNPAIVNGDTHIMPVCTVPKAAKDAGAAKPAAVAVPKCTGDQGLYALDPKSKIFCAATDPCTTDKDCNGKGTCTDAMIMQDDGTPALSHNGAPMGGKICKPK